MHDTEKEISHRKKPKSILLRFIFSRFFVIVFVLILEILFIIYIFNHLSSNWSIGSIVLYDLLAIIILLNTNWQKNEYKVLWITILILLPGAGAIFYFTYRLINRFSFASRKVDSVINNTKLYNIDNSKLYDEMLPVQEKNSFYNYLYYKQHFLPMTNNDVTYFDDGRNFFDSLLKDLRNAKKSIYLEFFIISNGILWTEVSNILKEKVSLGLDVKLMYDGLNITNDFSIKEDEIAYTGGMNIADEYANYYHKYGIWKDAGVRVSGDCARTFQLLFLQVWMMTIKDIDRDFHKYLPYHILNDNTNTKLSDIDFKYICSYTDFPNDTENVSEDLYTMMIEYSYKYLYIMTPYLILSESLVDTLIRAKKRGVDVRIILPHIPDKPLVHFVSRSYYKILIANGIRCYEFIDGFVHSKVFLHDDKRAIVGTANFDYRSLYLHYEDGLYIYKDKCIKDIKKDFDTLFDRCKEYSYYKEIPLYQRFLGSVLKVFAPQF